MKRFAQFLSLALLVSGAHVFAAQKHQTNSLGLTNKQTAVAGVGTVAALVGGYKYFMRESKPDVDTTGGKADAGDKEGKRGSVADKSGKGNGKPAVDSTELTTLKAKIAAVKLQYPEIAKIMDKAATEALKVQQKIVQREKDEARAAYMKKMEEQMSNQDPNVAALSKEDAEIARLLGKEEGKAS